MRKKRMLPFCLCTAAMVFVLGKTAYAWEAVDTNGDGVLDSIMFCDGYCDSFESTKHGHDGYIGMAPGGTQVYNEFFLNRLDEECRKNPGYVKRMHEENEIRRQEERVRLEIGIQIESQMDEIARQYFNDSMTMIEKIYAALEYFKANYVFDDNAPDVYIYDVPIIQAFLTKTIVLNKEQYNEMIQRLVIPSGGSDNSRSFMSEDGIFGETHYCSLGKYFPFSREEYFRCYLDPMVVNHSRNYFIDGKVYTLNLDTLELTEGWTEEMKQSLLDTTFCEDRIALFSLRSPEEWKWIPEEFKQFLKDNGYHASWMQ